MKLNIAILLIVGVATYLLTLHFSSDPTPTVNKVPDKEAVTKTIESADTMPAFTFTDIAGKEHSTDTFKDNIIILNFWASWCAPCVKEFPALIETARNNDDKGVILIALSSDLEEEHIHKFIRKMTKNQNINFGAKNMIIAWDKDQKITAGQFQTFKLPETIIIDRNQQIRHKLVGADWDINDLQTIIDDLNNDE